MVRVSLGGEWTDVDLGGRHTFRVKVADVEGEPQVVALEVLPAFEADGETLRDGRTLSDVVITREVLRAVPMKRLASVATKVQRGHFLAAMREAASPPEPHGKRSHPPEHYAEVAAVAQQARAAGASVREAIHTRWMVSHATADVWLRRAKDHGYLRGDLRKTKGDDHG